MESVEADQLFLVRVLQAQQGRRENCGERKRMLMEGNVRGLQQRAVGGGRTHRRKRISAVESADASRPGDLQVSLVGRPVVHRRKQLATARKKKPFTSAEASMVSRKSGQTPRLLGPLGNGPLGNDTADDLGNALGNNTADDDAVGDEDNVYDNM